MGNVFFLLLMLKNFIFVREFLILQNLHTIAVVGATPDVPLVAFTCELYHALNANLRVLRLSSQKIAEHLDATVLEK